MANVTLNQVSKTYPGGVVAVKSLDLEIADGEFVVLVGPSGCGKTTTLRMVAGLEELTGGTISIGERVVNNVHPKDRDVAMVFQDYALYPHMSVRKNMSFALKLRKVPKDEIARRVHETADLLGIGELLDRKPGALSGGQRQRVAVGRAIVRNPQVSLFDEPLSNLDAKLRTQMRAELKSLHMRLGTTTIYVTHDQEEAMTLGQRLVVMAEGEVQQIGPPLDVYREPANRFVAGFVGSPAMNFIDGRVEGSSFVAGDGVSIDVGTREREGELVLGIRPEHLRPSTNGAGLPVEIEVTEPLGDRVDVYGTTVGGTKVIARVDAATTCEPGQTVTFAVDPAAAHVFESGAYGARI